MPFAFISFVIAAVCFFLSWIAADITHLIDAGLFFTALGLALGALPATSGWFRRPPQ